MQQYFQYLACHLNTQHSASFEAYAVLLVHPEDKASSTAGAKAIGAVHG